MLNKSTPPPAPRTINAIVPAKLVSKMDAHADRHSVSRSDVIRWAITDYLNRLMEK